MNKELFLELPYLQKQGLIDWAFVDMNYLPYSCDFPIKTPSLNAVNGYLEPLKREEYAYNKRTAMLYLHNGFCLGAYGAEEVFLNIINPFFDDKMRLIAKHENYIQHLSGAYHVFVDENNLSPREGCDLFSAKHFQLHRDQHNHKELFLIAAGSYSISRSGRYNISDSAKVSFPEGEAVAVSSIDEAIAKRKASIRVRFSKKQASVERLKNEMNKNIEILQLLKEAAKQEGISMNNLEENRGIENEPNN